MHPSRLWFRLHPIGCNALDQLHHARRQLGWVKGARCPRRLTGHPARPVATIVGTAARTVTVVSGRHRPAQGRRPREPSGQASLASIRPSSGRPCPIVTYHCAQSPPCIRGARCAIRADDKTNPSQRVIPTCPIPFGCCPYGALAWPVRYQCAPDGACCRYDKGYYTPKLGAMTPELLRRASVRRVPNQPKTPMHSFRCPDALWESAKAAADEAGVTLTDVLQQALVAFVKRAEKSRGQ